MKNTRALMKMRPPGPLRDGLQQFIATLHTTTIMAEIGCYAGESALMFAAKVQMVFCVDPWTPYQERNDNSFDGIVSAAAAELAFDVAVRDVPARIVKIKLASQAALLLFEDNSLDCVYIDGNHEEAQVVADIEGWILKVHPGGILAGHDYGHAQFGGVKRAVDHCLGGPQQVYADFTWAVKVPS